MTQQTVERALGKLLTDENFRERFFTNPEIATWEVGFTPSPIELEALSRPSHEAVARFSEDLDECGKCPHVVGTRARIRAQRAPAHHGRRRAARGRPRGLRSLAFLSGRTNRSVRRDRRERQDRRGRFGSGREDLGPHLRDDRGRGVTASGPAR